MRTFLSIAFCYDNVTGDSLCKLYHFHKKWSESKSVSAEQPSIIDDLSITHGFYNAPAVAVIFAQKDFPFNVVDAFCIAENMILEAHALGVDSCMVSRAEATFALPKGQQLQQAWGISSATEAKVLVTFGFHEGTYPHSKPRKENRNLIIG